MSAVASGSVESLNAFAERTFSWAQGAGLASLVVFGVVGLLWLVLRRRVSAHLGHLLFLVPFVPLVTPAVVRLELPGWLARAVPAAHPASAVGEDAAATPPVGDVHLLEDRSGSFVLEAVELPPPAAPVPSGKAWVLLVWLSVATALVLRFLATQVRTDRILRAAPPLAGPEGARVRAALARLAPRVGLRRRVAVVACEQVSTPAVWGVRKPVLVLSEGLLQGLHDRQLDWVLLHELAHLARRDLVTGCLQRLLQILWFFHPLAWITGRLADELREAACDETALALSGASLPSGVHRRLCAEALLEVASRRAPAAPTPALLLSLRDEKNQMKKRILRMLDSHRVPARRASAAGLAGLLALASSSLVNVAFAQERRQAPVVEVEEAEEEFELVEAVDDEEARQAVELSLAWLQAQQAPDGHWPTGPATEADTGELNSVGVTGLVLLALERAQVDAPDAARARAIEGGLAFLAAVQDRSGLFGRPEGHCFMQSHAVATRAWLRLRGDRPLSAWKPQAERALAVILHARNPYMGWRFDLEPTGDCDSFTTGLMLAALHEAREAGLEVPATAWSEPLEYLNALTEPKSGRTGYDKAGGNDARLVSKKAAFPAELTQLGTAVALRTRLDWGQEPSSQVVRRGTFLVSESAPEWDVERGSIDYYYWLFGTRALAPIGGPFFEHWRASLADALVPNQQVDASGGWWPAVDAWSTEGTSVHATAVCTLALQAAL